MLKHPLCYALLWLLATPLQAQEIDKYFEDFAAEWVRFNPDLAVSVRYFSGAEQERLERQLTPQTRVWTMARVRLAEKGLRGLRRFDNATLTATERTSLELMRWQLQSVVDQARHLDYFFPLDQFQGANVGLVEALTLRHPLATARDVDNYLARLLLVGPRMKEATQEARPLVSKRLIPPRFILESTLASMRAFVEPPAAQNPLVTSLVQKARAIEGLTPERHKDLERRASQTVTQSVYPAWREAIALLESILPTSTNDAGLWRFAEGAVVYEQALKRFTTTDLTAEQVHNIGLQQVARIETEMNAVLQKIGRTQGSVRDRMRQLEIDLRYDNPESDASRAQIMKDIDALMADSLQRSAPLFARMPRSTVIAQPFPRFREASAAANYNRAPLDGSRPAIFQMPLRPSRMTRLGLRTLVYHETVPGHHFQIALEQENPALPKFRQARVLGGISALSEGWGLYAERLAAELGWYENDPEGLLGQLSAELWRARRLVVDTGLHAKRWTRQQAIDYGIEASEVERYVVNPGQACSYMIGQLKLLELRDRARRELGGKFSLQQFHSAVLDTGTTPLSMVEQAVDRYISATPTP